MLLILDFGPAIDLKFEQIEIFWRFFGKKIPRKNAVGSFDFEMNPRLRGDQLPEARIAKDLPQLRIVCAFDHKIAVKILMPDLHVLHAQVFAEFAKNSLAIDGKAKTARIQKGRAHAGVVVFAVFFEGDEPAGVGRVNFTAPPKTAIDIVGIDFARQDILGTGGWVTAVDRNGGSSPNRIYRGRLLP
jgi:hypothetical protein